ncbi:MAG: hypothetical protein EOO65_01625, partial [Methanosarcinales archaeon]
MQDLLKEKELEEADKSPPMFDYVIGFKRPEKQEVPPAASGKNKSSSPSPTARDKQPAEAIAQPVTPATIQRERSAAETRATNVANATAIQELQAAFQEAVKMMDPAAMLTLLPSEHFDTIQYGLRLSEERLYQQAEAENCMLLASSGVSLLFNRSYKHLFPRLARTNSIFTHSDRCRLTWSLLKRMDVQIPPDLLPEDEKAAAKRGAGSYKYKHLLPPELLSDSSRTVEEAISHDIMSAFPFHDTAELVWLHNNWVIDVANTLAQPLDRIAAYFSEQIAFYFAWMQFYCRALMPPAIAGVLLLLLQSVSGTSGGPAAAVFALFMALWGSITMKMWRRRQVTLAFDWAVLGAEELEEQRPQFRGVREYNPVTRRFETRETKAWAPMARFMGVTVPAMTFCLCLAATYMLACERLRHILSVETNAANADTHGTDADVTPVAATSLSRALLDVWHLYVQGPPVNYHAPVTSLSASAPSLLLTVLSLVPTVLFAAGVGILDSISTTIARKTTDFENHKTHSAYRNALIGKYALILFMDNFLALFYIAFVQQNLELLHKQLTVLLVYKAAINNVQETVLPMIMSRWRLSRATYGAADEAVAPTSMPTVAAPAVLTPLEASAAEAQRQSSLETYDDFDDVAEMFVQFGQVTLFASMFPLAPLLALVNNVMEIHTDAFKLCTVQRPHARRVASLGTWTAAFDMVSYAAVATNLALMYVAGTRDADTSSSSVSTKFAAFGLAVALEHLIIVLKVALEARVSDMPVAVRDKMANEVTARLAILQGVTAAASATGATAVSELPPVAVASAVAAAPDVGAPVTQPVLQLEASADHATAAAIAAQPAAHELSQPPPLAPGVEEAAHVPTPAASAASPPVATLPVSEPVEAAMQPSGITMVGRPVTPPVLATLVKDTTVASRQPLPLP